LIMMMIMFVKFLEFALLRSTRRHRDGARMSTGRNTAVGTRGDGATAATSGVLLENTLEVVIGIVVELGGGSVTVSRLGSSRKRRRVGGIVVVDRHFFWRKGDLGFFLKREREELFFFE